MGKFKQILLLISQIALIIFAGFICTRYLTSVAPEFGKFHPGIINSNPVKIALGPIFAIFILLSSHALGRLLWINLGGISPGEDESPSFILLSATGLAILAVITWVCLIPGWRPYGLIFFLMIIALVVEISPTIKAFMDALSIPFEERESPSVKAFRFIFIPLIIVSSVTPFLDPVVAQPEWLANPSEAFKASFGNIPIGLDVPLYSLCAGFAGKWAVPAMNLAMVWLMIMAMQEIARRLFDSLPAGLLGGILFLCIPFQYEIMIQPHNGLILAFFLMASYSSLTRYLFQDDTSALITAGLFLGIGISVSATAIPFASVFLLYAIIATILPIRKGLAGRIGIVVVAIIIAGFCGSLLLVQNYYLAKDVTYPISAVKAGNFEIEKESDDEDAKAPVPVTVPPQAPDGISFPEKYGKFTGVGYKLTMSTDGDLSKGPQGLGPFFMAFIPGILLIMITRRHTKEAWTLILLLLVFYLFAAYMQKGFSLRSIYAIFGFQALVTGYIVDRLYLLSKLDEKRWISLVFIWLFVPVSLIVFFWTCTGYGIVLENIPVD